MILLSVTVVYAVAVVLWTLLASLLRRTLSARHPLLFQTLCATSGPGRAGLGSDLALLRFVFAGRDRFTRDRKLVLLCGAMRSILCVYGLFFLVVPTLLAL
ncbi:MAG TPA: hypothetical protein VNB06_05865 [Thermoanaerobaculia bacterium]|nr:hypothetical protein [Thermoanaerobaculia bacterium]